MHKQRPSQQVHESVSPETPNGYVTVTMERTSTAEKKRKRASLFPAKAARLREQDADRKRKAPVAEERQKEAAPAQEAAPALASTMPAALRAD